MARRKKRVDDNLQMSLFTDADFESLLTEHLQADDSTLEGNPALDIEDSPSEKESISDTQIAEPVSDVTVESDSDEEEIVEVDRSILIQKMQETLRHLEYTSPNTIRLICLESSIIYKKGLQLNQKYTLNALPNKRLNWYDFVALYYCSFAHAFPTMLEKIDQEYMDCYQEASRNLEL